MLQGVGSQFDRISILRRDIKELSSSTWLLWVPNMRRQLSANQQECSAETDWHFRTLILDF